MKIWCLELNHRRALRTYPRLSWCDCPKYTAEEVVHLRYVKRIKDRNSFKMIYLAIDLT
jgi:hypothetical protein